MGNALKRAEGHLTAHYFLICDRCGLEADIKTCLEEFIYKAKNKWHSLKDNGKRKEYCNSCASALGYIKNEGEDGNERKEIGTAESIEAVPAWN